MVVTRKHHELHEQLGRIVGAKYVSDDLDVLLSYTRDVSSFPPKKPQGAVVRPGSVDEVVELVRLANQTRTPLIPMGGKASLSGVPPGQPGRGIIVDMTRMNEVIEIDEANLAVTTQCGITLGKLASKVNEKGFNIHTAYTPHYVDTVGGQMSGITGGGLGVYGFSVGYHWHYILGLKVVLPNGSVVDTGTGEGSVSTYRGHTWARGMQGPDLTGMFIGDGGIFGIKVEATYRMFHLPKFQKTGARCWDTVEEAFEAYYELGEIDPFLYMQPFATSMILSPEIVTMAAPGAEPAWILFFINIGETQEEVDLKNKTADKICAKHGGRVTDPAVSAFCEEFIPFARNMNSQASMGQIILFDLVLSRRDLLEAYKWSRECYSNTLREMGVDPATIPTISGIFPAGTGYGGITISPLFDQNDKELHKALHETHVEWLEQAMRRGYIIEGSQGHQSRLKVKQWTPEYYNYVLSLKNFLDPNNIMNPGIYFP